ncbi:hypothetical protein L1987_43312 [Smallanthus sonchifolius]|uniref:Uncharacterized protein n=1 Tax=Smallanthus sonchifolius TaxID=185202 RepID=A0ACB9GLE3_9ASTR|nr:hypothetical protein L1987_43312 [Smallanthus sonchifolius]
MMLTIRFQKPNWVISRAVIGQKTGEVPTDLDDDEEEYDWLVNLNDELFERFDASVDQFKMVKNKEEEIWVRAMNLYLFTPM